MASQVVIYDYIDASHPRRINRIAEWLDGIGKRPKARLVGIFHNLEDTPAAKWHTTKAAKKLTGQPDLWEIIAFVDKIQWRVIGFFGTGAGEFTLLVGCLKKGQKLDPPSTLDKAQDRKLDVQGNPMNWRTSHDYS